jgi:methanesulfonate monooxygenase large subunit
MSRTAAKWREKPKLPATHYVNSRIYTDESIHQEEIEKIWNKLWLIACHESELPNKYDFRTFMHPCGRSLVMIRGEDMKVRTFYNTCSHRGNMIVREPAGNAQRITCVFHHWSYDSKGARRRGTATASAKTTSGCARLRPRWATAASSG